MKIKIVLVVIFSAIIGLSFSAVSHTVLIQDQTESPLSEQTQECLECHMIFSPGIVEDWKTSEHFHMTPGQALQKSALERKVTSQNIPEELLNTAVGCYECHGRNPSQHKDNFEHFGFSINIVVSPEDCATCHYEEKEQYSDSKKGNALLNLQKNPVYHTLVETITSLKEIDGKEIIKGVSSDSAKAETCYACHGTRIEVKGMKTISTELGEIEVPQLYNWPNQGVGRINPDGSQGACTPCHPRHSFSIEIARKPETCSQCHLEPDVPAWNVYRESKHGNIYLSQQSSWNWDSVPWTVGKDFKAPTCAVCHSSLVVDPEGEVIASRSHDFGARLWVRIFGLIYSHPQPKSGKTFLIKNKDGLPLPISFTGALASDHLIDENEQSTRQQMMKKICQACHSSSWADNHFEKLRISIKEADRMVWAATELILDAWDKEIISRTNPFDEALEQKWIEQWLFFANSVRYASAMSGPDYAAFKNGWWKLTKNLYEMMELMHTKEIKE
jgi:hypothetical protein